MKNKTIKKRGWLSEHFCIEVKEVLEEVIFLRPLMNYQTVSFYSG